MPKGHFDIGAWAQEKKPKRQEIIAKSRTIVNLKDDILGKEAQEKVVIFWNVLLVACYV